MERLKNYLKSLLPRRLYRALVLPYHLGLSWFYAHKYGFPGRSMTVIGVTGTKGKSSVTEMITAILEEAGHKVASTSTIRFKIGGAADPNLYKMTLPGHGFLQEFLRKAYDSGATYAVIELSSEGAIQYRHAFASLDALVFTNLEKEHLEAHGSIEKYFQAKFLLAKSLMRSSKRPRAIIANKDNPYGVRFLQVPVEAHIPFSLTNLDSLQFLDGRVSFTYEDVRFMIPHPGEFSAMNALAAIKTARFFGVPLPTASKALEQLTHIPGRAESIQAGQTFRAIVDYAHTPDSLRALYNAYPGRKICVLGNTGGGRDTWKRPEMGRIADEACDEVILTNEDPYDEDPEQIVREMADGMQREPRTIMDRREAIKTALSLANSGDTVLVTGKGTDPFIMIENGKKIPWSDALVVREELEKLNSQTV